VLTGGFDSRPLSGVNRVWPRKNHCWFRYQHANRSRHYPFLIGTFEPKWAGRVGQNMGENCPSNAVGDSILLDALCKPGTAYDRRGCPIYPGDLIKSYHFTGKKRKKYYLYHVAVLEEKNEFMEMVPVSHLQKDKIRGGGRCWLRQRYVENSEVICGYGPGEIISYEDRPRLKGKTGNTFKFQCIEG